LALPVRAVCSFVFASEPFQVFCSKSEQIALDRFVDLG